MSPSLNDEQCIACRRDAPRATEAEIDELRAIVPEWELNLVEDVLRLERTFKCSNFRDALDFTQAVGLMAEAEGHHPSILTQWGKVRVSWWTTKIKGLNRNDFIMAAKTDELRAQQQESGKE